LQCSGGRKAAESGRLTLLFYRHVKDCQTSFHHGGTESTEEKGITKYLSPCLCASVMKSVSAAAPNFTPASRSSRSSRSRPSTPDILSPLPPRTSEMRPHPLPAPFPLHRCGSM